MKGAKFWLKLAGLFSFILVLYLLVSGVIMLVGGIMANADAANYLVKFADVPFKFAGAGTLGDSVSWIGLIAGGVAYILFAAIYVLFFKKAFKYSKIQPVELRKRDGRMQFVGWMTIVLGILDMLPEFIGRFKGLDTVDYILFAAIFLLFLFTGLFYVFAGKSIRRIEKKYGDEVFESETHGYMQAVPTETELADLQLQSGAINPDEMEYDEYGRMILKAKPLDFAAQKELERLNVMRNQGVIDIEEYNRRREEILSLRR